MKLPTFSFVMLELHGHVWVPSKNPFDYLGLTKTIEDEILYVTYSLPMSLSCNQQDVMGQPLLHFNQWAPGKSHFSFMLYSTHAFKWNGQRWVGLSHLLRFCYDADIADYYGLFVPYVTAIKVFDIPGFPKINNTQVIVEQNEIR